MTLSFFFNFLFYLFDAIICKEQDDDQAMREETLELITSNFLWGGKIESESNKQKNV